MISREYVSRRNKDKNPTRKGRTSPLGARNRRASVRSMSTASKPGTLKRSLFRPKRSEHNTLFSQIHGQCSPCSRGPSILRSILELHSLSWGKKNIFRSIVKTAVPSQTSPSAPSLGRYSVCWNRPQWQFTTSTLFAHFPCWLYKGIEPTYRAGTKSLRWALEWPTCSRN